MSENSYPASLPLKPDLVIKFRGIIYIIDVTCPFDDRWAALASAWDNKVEKYTPLIPLLSNNSNEVKILPLVVGSLGSWFPKNDEGLKNITSSSISRLRSLMISSTIRHSSRLWYEFKNGVEPPDSVTNASTKPNQVNSLTTAETTFNSTNDDHFQSTSQMTPGQDAATFVDPPPIQQTSNENGIVLDSNQPTGSNKDSFGRVFF